MAYDWTELNRFRNETFYVDADWELMADWLLNHSWEQANFSLGFDWLFGYNEHWRSYNFDDPDSVNYKDRELIIDVSSTLDDAVFQAVQANADYISQLLNISIDVRPALINARGDADLEITEFSMLLGSSWAQEAWSSELEIIQNVVDTAKAAYYASTLGVGAIVGELTDDIIAEIVSFAMEELGAPPLMASLFEAAITGDISDQFEHLLGTGLTTVSSLLSIGNHGDVTFHAPGTTWDLNPFAAAAEVFEDNLPDGFTNHWHPSAFYHDMAVIYYGSDRIDHFEDGGGFFDSDEGMYENLTDSEIALLVQETLLHEITHVLGLGHLGDYNSSYDTVATNQDQVDAAYDNAITWQEVNLFSNDSVNYSVMSYFHEFDQPGVSFDGSDPVTWMGADLVALDMLYGLNTDVESEDTTWGYNSNVSIDYLRNILTDYEQLETKLRYGGTLAPTFSIYDTGGFDVLDLSETDDNARVDLRPDSFSNIQSGVNNLYIPDDVWIEKYVGGAVNDNVTDNDLDNTILTEHFYDTASGKYTRNELSTSKDTVDLVSNGDDYVETGGGNDTISIGSGTGHDTVFAGDGDDLIKISGYREDIVIQIVQNPGFADSENRLRHVIDTGLGNDVVQLEATPDTTGLYNSSFEIYTDYGKDTITTADGSDLVHLFDRGIIKTGGGEDLVIVTNFFGSSDSSIDTGDMEDTLIIDVPSLAEYRASIEGLNIGIQNTTLSISSRYSSTSPASTPPPTEIIALNDVENLIGSDRDDTMNIAMTAALAGILNIRGGEGDDTITFYGGTQTVEGGSGSDVIIATRSGHFYGQIAPDSDEVYGGDWAGNGSLFDAAPNPVLTADDIDRIEFTQSTPENVGTFELNLEDKTYTNDLSETFNIDGFEIYDFSQLGHRLTFYGSVDRDVFVAGTDNNDRFFGTGAEETLSGNGGHDYFLSSGGQTTIYGGTGNDTIDGVIGDGNVIFGDEFGEGTEALDPDGVDWFYAYSNHEKLNFEIAPKVTMGAYIELEVVGGKAINDNMSDTVPPIGIVTPTGIEGAPTNWATAYNIENVLIRGDREDTTVASYHDVIIGNTLDNYFDSTEGDDFQRGRAGNDTLIGGDGADTLMGDAGNDFYIGGAGIDEASFANELNVFVEMLDESQMTYFDTLTNSNALKTYENYRQFGLEGIFDGYYSTKIGDDSDVLFGIENLRGGAGQDTLSGNSDANFIWGGKGDDILWGGDGNDALYGENGQDELIYTSGNDLLDGGSGIDFISYALIEGPININLAETTFQNIIDGFTAAIRNIEGIVGTNENDTLKGAELSDAFRGGLGNDILTGNGGDDFLDGQQGDDTIDSGSGDDTAIGGAGNDQIETGTFDSLVSDHDLAVGGIGNDTVITQDGDDLIFGDEGTRDIDGNYILPGIETDNDGNDYLNGGRGNDTIYGGGGDDYIDSGLDDDSVYGGAGNDYVREYGSVYGSESDYTSGDDFYDGGSDKDTLDYSGSSHAINASLANKSISGVATGQDTVTNFEVLIATAYDDTISTADHSDTIYGGYGDDHITAIGGNDSILGDGGNDTIAVVDSSGRDTLYGGEGTDTLDLSGLSSGSVVSLVGNVLEAEIGVSKLESIENVLGSQNKDEIIGSKEGNILRGAGGDDQILGQGGSDTIEGGTGNDFIDISEPEATRDIIKFSNGDGNDTISGIDWDLFLQANDERMDKLDLSTFFDASENLVTQEDAKVEISADGNLIITFFEGSKLTILGSSSSFAETLERLEVSPLEFIESPEFSLALNAFGLGVWLGNGVVDGTENADLIDADYDSDPEGDKIDNSDAPISTNNDVIDAGKGNDTIFADAGSDQLVIESGDGDDDVELGPGDDLIKEADGSGDDTYDGGADLDTIDFSAVTSEMYINLNNGAAFSDTSGHDTVSKFERVISSQKSDEVFGTDLDSEYFETLAGDDTIFSGAGNDTIISGEDDDVINPGDGKDIVDAGSGDDVVAFRGLELSGLKILNGGIGIDTLNLSLLQTNATINLAEKTAFSGGNISELSSFENVVSTQFSDSIIGSDLANEINSGAGNDTIDGGDGQDTIYADAGDDIVDAGNGDDIIIAGSGLGDDTYKGGEGTDHIVYSSATAGILVNLAAGTAKSFSTQDASIGDDKISGVEKVTAGDFDDFIIGSKISNHIEALSGNDTIYGGYGDNTILGGAGDDLLIIGRGKSEIDGGSGNNKVLIDANVEDILFSKTDGTITVKTETIFANLTNVAELWLNDAVLDETLIKNGSEDIILSLDELNLGENNQNSGLIKISGRAEQGQILTADLDSLIDLDGVDQTSVTYQWFADGVVLEGAVLKELALSSDLVGASVRVDVAFNDNSGNREHARSMASKPIANVNDAPIGTHTIEGDLNVGSVLVVKNDGVVDPDGEISNVSYQWFRSGVKINGATDEIYELTNTDKFSTISVQMTYTDAAGFMNTVVSDPTDAVTSDGISTITLSATRKLFIPNNITLPTDFAFETLVQASSDLDEMRTNLVGSFNGLFVDTTAQDEDVTELGDFLNNVSIKSIARSQSVVLSKYDFEQLELGDAPELALSIQENSNNEELFVLSGLSQEKTLVLHGAQFVAVTGNARILGGTGQNTLFGDGASQNVMLGADDDMLSAGGGDDIVGSAGGNDTVSGGSGNDVTFGGTGNDSVNGGTGNDKVTDSWGTDELNGDDGNDVIRSFEGGDTINGGAGADTIYGSRGDDVISGGDDDDVIYGDTFVFASRGADELSGGNGDDVLQGGFGADTFIFNSGETGDNRIERIDTQTADFEVGIDKIKLLGFGDDMTADNILAQWQDTTEGAKLTAGDMSILLTGISTDDLLVTDFVFV